MVDGSAPRPDERLADEEQLLVRYHRTREPSVREELVARFMPLARSLANRYAGGSEPTEDLHQVASLGLVKAIDGFDPSLGHSFASYAAPTILGELKRHFRDRSRQVHMPRGLQERIALIERAIDELPTELGYQPSAAQVAERVGLSLEEVLEAMEASSARHTYSLEASVGPEEEGARLGDTIGDIDPGYSTVEFGEAISRTIASLSERERMILHLRFVEDLTQSEIAKRVGISQMHVSRLLRRALDEVRRQVPRPDDES
jgi:RNA polymerase sigma-B factor